MAMCCKWRWERKTTEGMAWGVTGNRSDMKGLAVTWENLNYLFFQLNGEALTNSIEK